MISNEKVTIEVVEGEVMIAVGRVEDFDEAMAAAEDMGLPIVMAQAAADEIGADPDIFGPDSAEAADIADLDSCRPGPDVEDP